MDEIKGRVKRVHYNDGGTGASLKLSPGGESDDFWGITRYLGVTKGEQSSLTKYKGESMEH